MRFLLIFLVFGSLFSPLNAQELKIKKEDLTQLNNYLKALENVMSVKRSELVSNDSVPYTDLRKYSSAFSRLYSSKISKNGIVILYSGNDVKLMKETRRGLVAASKLGYPIKQMFVGRNETEGVTDSIHVYVKKFPFFSLAAPNKPPYNNKERPSPDRLALVIATYMVSLYEEHIDKN